MNNHNVFENIAVVVLAAGMGTRMKSDKAKVLHTIHGKPMISYVLETATQIAPNNVILIIGHQADTVREVVSHSYDVIFALQEKQLGTGDAVSHAIPYISEHIENILILCGDVPLLTTDTLIPFIHAHLTQHRDISLLAVNIDNPTGYGRVLFDEKMNISAIVEESDATDEQKHIKTINTGIYCVKKEILTDSLKKIKSDNLQGEFYLTDIIEIGYNEKKAMGVWIGENTDEFIGINSQKDLFSVEKMIYKKMI